MLDGLVDTGADAILASDLLADQLGIDLAEHEGETAHAVGGHILTARYRTITLRLHPHDGEIHEYCEWDARVGFTENWHSYSFVLLGSVGFLDRFTVVTPAERKTDQIARLTGNQRRRLNLGYAMAVLVPIVAFALSLRQRALGSAHQPKRRRDGQTSGGFAARRSEP